MAEIMSLSMNEMLDIDDLFTFSRLINPYT